VEGNDYTSCFTCYYGPIDTVPPLDRFRSWFFALFGSHLFIFIRVFIPKESRKP
jgi:hypothetical protein